MRTRSVLGGSRWLRRHSLGRSNAQTDADKNHSQALAKHKPHDLAGAHAERHSGACRLVAYLNNIVEQDHGAIRRRVRASQGFRFFAMKNE